MGVTGRGVGRDTRPLPGRLGGRAGGASSCSDLSHATHAEPRAGDGTQPRGGVQPPATPGGCILLCSVGISTQHICKRGVGGEPPEKLKKEKKKERK